MTTLIESIAALESSVRHDRDYWIFAVIGNRSDTGAVGWTIGICPILDGQGIYLDPSYGDQAMSWICLDGSMHPCVILAALKALPFAAYREFVAEFSSTDLPVDPFARWFKRQYPWGLRVQGESPELWDWATATAITDSRVRFGWPLIEPPADYVPVQLAPGRWEEVAGG